jgi:phosphomannomutase
VKNRNKFIFDVDGTLTPSRGIIDLQFKAFFNTFCLMNDVYLVTGSDKPKTVEQLSEHTYNLAKRVYQCSGSDVYEGDNSILKSVWELPALARTFLISCEYESDFSIRTGIRHIEERSGMVNFSVLGRSADAEQRAAYVAFEEQNGERKKIADAFNTMFPELQATVGGETGIDIAPRGSDKSQILRDFKEDDTIHFYGDAMFEGGNDKPLADALQKYQLGFSHQVNDWKHTWEKLREHTTNGA